MLSFVMLPVPVSVGAHTLLKPKIKIKRSGIYSPNSMLSVFFVCGGHVTGFTTFNLTIKQNDSFHRPDQIFFTDTLQLHKWYAPIISIPFWLFKL